MELTVTLPDTLANEAKAAGLLAPEAIERLLREAIERRRQIDSFFTTVERLRAAGIPPMSEEEIQAEVDAVRAERRAAGKAGRADRP
ncbi:MAG: hypothetical protein IT514_09975 [Burkholderiales bacterium]|nr:hypothetical protein [Burkholderiales bacterium]